jgi:hypothetical protein
MRSAFSAVDTLDSKSSIVAMNVANFPSALIFVTTQLFSLTVLTDKPRGVLKLSGETALAMASAVCSSRYSSVTVASKLLASQLPANQFVGDLYEILNLT